MGEHSAAPMRPPRFRDVRKNVVGLSVAIAVIATLRIALQGGTLQQPPSDAAPFAVGVTSWDGAIQVLGRFDGARWVNTWPEVEEPGRVVPALADAPTSWLGKPVPRQWHLWHDGSSFPIRVTGTRRGRGETQGCAQPLVLSMSLPPGIPRGLFDGLIAVDTTREVEGVEDVRPDGSQGLKLEPLVRAAVTASEGAILRADVEWPGDTKARVATAPIRIEVLSRPAATRSPFAVYFAATRRIEWDNSTTGILVEGWIHAPGQGPWNPANVHASDVTARQFWGEADPGSALKAQAIFRVGTRAFWLMSAPGYEWISFNFVEVTATSAREVLETSGGGC